MQGKLRELVGDSVRRTLRKDCNNTSLTRRATPPRSGIANGEVFEVFGTPRRKLFVATGDKSEMVVVKVWGVVVRERCRENGVRRMK